MVAFNTIGLPAVPAAVKVPVTALVLVLGKVKVNPGLIVKLPLTV